MASDLDRVVSQAIERLAKKPKPQLVGSFLPTGRASYTIYAVSLHQHENVVKVGRTARWGSRLKSYQYWNLSAGDAVSKATRFVINEEFADLDKVEAFVLARVAEEFGIRFGKEWFVGSHEDVSRSVDRAMADTGLSYEIEVIDF